MNNNVRKGFAIFDVIVALSIVTIVGIFIGKYIMGILNLNKDIEISEKFSTIVTSVNEALKKKENIKAYVTTPRFVLSPEITISDLSKDTLQNEYEDNPSGILYFNYEKALYGCTTSETCSDVDENAYLPEPTETYQNLFGDIYNFTLYDLRADNEDRKKAQENFFNIPEYLVRKYGNIPLVFVIQRYSQYEGFRFPYKIFTIIDLGPVFFQRLKAFMKEATLSDSDITYSKVQKVMAFLFPISDNGVYFRNKIDFNDLATNHTDFYKTLKKLFGSNPEVFFAEIKNKVKVMTINTMDIVQSYLKNTLDQMKTIKSNVEDWAVIQARIAAYDSVNGNSMDKDYFITCTSDGCDDVSPDPESSSNITIDKTRTLKPNLADDAEIDNSIENNPIDSKDIDEMDLSNGFFVCKSFHNNESGHFKGYYCNKETPLVISRNNCADNIKYVFSVNADVNSLSSLAEVEGVARLDVPTNVSGKSCLLGEATRRLLSSTGFTVNSFDLPVYFSNSSSVKITNDAYEYLFNDGDDSGYAFIENNVPIQNGHNNPPYNASLLTIMPWFFGGIEDFGVNYSDSYKTTNFGIIHLPVFAHVF